jgi:hypothetical protein
MGQKQTSDWRPLMSALPPKSGHRAPRPLCAKTATLISLFDHLARGLLRRIIPLDGTRPLRLAIVRAVPGLMGPRASNASGRSRREEFVPHCSESCWRALQGTICGGPTYVEELARARCLPAKLERAIDCMRLIAGRTARPSSAISIICERCSHRSPLRCSVAALWRHAEALPWLHR